MTIFHNRRGNILEFIHGAVNMPAYSMMWLFYIAIKRTRRIPSKRNKFPYSFDIVRERLHILKPSLRASCRFCGPICGFANAYDYP